MFHAVNTKFYKRCMQISTTLIITRSLILIYFRYIRKNVFIVTRTTISFRVCNKKKKSILFSFYIQLKLLHDECVLLENFLLKVRVRSSKLKPEKKKKRFELVDGE